MAVSAEIITIGTELLLGEVVDTNTSVVAQMLASLGINCYFQSTVGDNAKRLKQAIHQAKERAKIIILCGGLGPTQDDITKKTLAEDLNKPLVVHEDSFARIKRFYADSDHIPEGNINQALMIEESLPLTNDVGMAVGVFYEDHSSNRTYIVLPGPPTELQTMTERYLKPLLIKKNYHQRVLKSRSLYFFGLTESMLGEALSDLISAQTDPTIAIYAQGGLLSVRLTTSTDKNESRQLFDQVEEEIKSRVGEFFIGYEEKKPSELLAELLAEKKQSLELIETITGGYLTTALAKDLHHSPLAKSQVLINQINEFRQLDAMIDWSLEESKSMAADHYHLIVQGNFEESTSAHYPALALVTLQMLDDSYVLFQIDHRQRQNSNPAMMSEYIANNVRQILAGESIVESFEQKIIRDDRIKNVRSE